MIFLLIFLSTFNFNNFDNIKSSVNSGEIVSKSIIFLTLNDELKLYSSKDMYWVFYKPEFRVYDNLFEGAKYLSKIEYNTILISDKKSNSFDFKKLKPGTYYVGILSTSKSIQISSCKPIHMVYNNIIQLVVRENDSYIGFLTEQLGLPFILPPKMLNEYGHQTDLRIGSDCAELAIYGMRRMGYKIPYCGPKGLKNYLEPTDLLIQGTIIHYGYQVSVLYEDRGQRGKLDGEDLIIHAYKDKIAIEKLGNTELLQKEYKLYKWKINI